VPASKITLKYKLSFKQYRNVKENCDINVQTSAVISMQETNKKMFLNLSTCILWAKASQAGT